MVTKNAGYSPNILIYLEIDQKRIRLADVLYRSAVLYDKAEVPPRTLADLVFSIDGVEERDQIILENGISETDDKISFSYLDTNRANGRHLEF